MKIKIKFPLRYINELRNFIHEYSPTILGKPYKAIYRGQKIKHITLVYREGKREKYRRIPESAYKNAQLEKHKWRPVHTNEQARLWNKPVAQDVYHGHFTANEIRQKTQEISNKLAQEGKQGLLSVAVRYYGADRGLWKQGFLSRYGQPVLFPNLDYYGEEDQPDVYTAFSIYRLTR